VKRVGVAFAGICLSGLVLGCTDGSLPAPVEQERTPIVHGDASAPSDDAVVSLSANGIACTAALIAPDVLVTALHCVSQINLVQSFNCRSDGTLAPGSSGGMIGPTVDPSTITVSIGAAPKATGVHGKTIYGTNSPVVCRDDLAVVVLDGPVPVDVPPVSLRFTRSTKDGESVRAVGYGLDENNHDTGRNERDDLTILGVGSPNSVVAGDPGVSPRTVTTGEGSCHGDSGGPLFSQDTGAEIGVYSLLSTNSCTGPDIRNVYTQVAPYEDMIRMALTSVGEEPIVEVTPVTGGGEGGAAGQAGDSGTSGAPGDAGAPAATTGGTGASGGSTGVGGGSSGATGGSGAVGGSSGGTGGDTTMGDDTSSEAGAESQGSGSRRDPSCTCRTGRTDASTPWPALGFAFAALSFLRRRRSV